MKDLKISKKLLEEVLGYEVDAFLGINENEIDYTCCKDKNIGYEDISINIYEFAFKCKEWAFNNGGYVLQSKSYVIKNYKFTKGAFCYTHFPMGGMGNSHWADTEVEAIIKACEWILQQKENK